MPSPLLLLAAAVAGFAVIATKNTPAAAKPGLAGPTPNPTPPPSPKPGPVGMPNPLSTDPCASVVDSGPGGLPTSLQAAYANALTVESDPSKIEAVAIGLEKVCQKKSAAVLREKIALIKGVPSPTGYGTPTTLPVPTAVPSTVPGFPSLPGVKVNPKGIPCPIDPTTGQPYPDSGIENLPGDLRTVVSAAVLNPASTAQQLEDLAVTLDDACQTKAAAEVRVVKAAKATPVLGPDGFPVGFPGGFPSGFPGGTPTTSFPTGGM